MAEIGAKISWGLWCRIHAKAILQAIPLTFLVMVEGRDMYYRSGWQVQEIPLENFKPGDVIAISNRWYTMPTWGHALYSLLSKVLLKSCWDDVGVISSVGASETGQKAPNILYCDFEGAHEMPLKDFLAFRRPRGAAVRALELNGEDCPTLSPIISSMFKEEICKIKPQPWYLFNASKRLGNEHKYYQFCAAMNEQRVKIWQMKLRGNSSQAISIQQQKLADMKVMQSHFEKYAPVTETFHLFNGSMVAYFFATFQLIDRILPSPSRYVPQDFAHRIPFLGAVELKEPVVFFRL